MKENDQRVKITKLLIKKTFTELLTKKPIQKISVKELCEKAGINRGTFYSHYEDIYDLLEKIENEMLEEFKIQLSPILTSSEADLTSLDFFISIFKFLANHSDICIIMFSETGDKTFVAKMLELGKAQCISAYTKHFKNASPDQIEHFYSFVSAGCISILVKWLEGGMKDSIDDLAKTTEELISCTIKYLES